MESSSFSGSSTKRAKAPVNITQVASCLVDGCNADLSLCREYHRRHKVCEMHSKSSKVAIVGREQRFCQQCSRFHSLVEFDEGKRSCRIRLDGHNKRRRKPQTDLLPRNSVHGFSTPSGTRILSFSNPRILPSSVVSSSWSGIVKPENNDMALFNNNLNHVETQNYAFSPHSNSYKGVSFDPDGVNESNQDIALSLLSSSVPNNNTTREFGFIHPEPIVPVQVPQSLVHNLDYSGLSQFSFTQERKEVVSAIELSHGGPRVGASNLRFPETFRNVPEGSSSGDSHQTLTFMWG